MKHPTLPNVQSTRAARLLVAALSAAALLASGSTVAACAQEDSVRPGVNDGYTNANVEQWLEKLEGHNRAIFRFRHAIVATLALDPGMEVADVGAGTGFLTLLIAAEVGPEGRVFAEDITPEFLAHIEEITRKQGLGNVTTVLGDSKSTKLAPASVDLVLVSDTYHHFEFPRPMLESIHQALRPDGRLVVIDFERVVGVSTKFAIEHVRAGKGTVTDEIKDNGFDFVREVPLMEGEGQFYLEFRKR